MALYENSTFEYVGQVHLIYANSWGAQTFTPQATHNITSVILSLGRKPGAIVGTVTVSIRETEDDKPIGNDLCSGTTAGNTLPELSGEGSPEEREITFGVNPELSSGVKYAIVVRVIAADYDNGLYWHGSATSVYDDGARCISVNSGASWSVLGTKENWFEEYGDPSSGDPPEDPINPDAPHEATGVKLDSTTLSWEDGGGAETYDVYFRTFGEFFETVASDIPGLSIDVTEFVSNNGNYGYGKLYFWCVIAKNTAGSNNDPPSGFGLGYGGVIWEFTSLVFVPPTPSGITWDDPGNESGYSGVPTGGNNMVTPGILVAAANNRIWFEGIYL